MLLAILILTLVADVVFPRSKTGGATIAEALVFSVIIFVWVVEDARRRNFHLSALLKIGVVALGAIFVPVYMIRSRGLRLASKGIAIFVAQLVGCLFAAVLVLTALQMAGLLTMRR
jgi:hypothetical protein